MFKKLFGRATPSIDSISFDTFNWQMAESNDSVKAWRNLAENAQLSLHFFNIPPDLPSLDENTLRAMHRKSLGSGGALITVKVEDATRFPIVETVFKIRIGQQIHYVGSFIIPFKGFSYVIKIQAIELGATGLRDSLIADKCLRNGTIVFTDDGMQGWDADPYDKDYENELLMNISDREEYDDQFPDHPLTIIRGRLRQVRRSLKATSEVLNAPRFED